MDLHIRKFLLLLGDVAILYVALYFMLTISFPGEALSVLFFSHVGPFSILFFFWLVLFYILDLYDLSAPPVAPAFLSRFTLALILCFLLGALFFYVVSFTQISPKTNLLIVTALFGVFSYGWRLLFATKISRLAPWRIGLLGLQQEDAELRDLIRSLKHHGYGCVDLHAGDLVAQVSQQRLHAVVIPSDSFFQPETTQQLYECLATGVRFLDVGEAYELFARRIPLSTTDQSWFVRNVYGRERGGFKQAKRAMDLVAATFILVLTSPILGVIALAIKLEGHGTIFYSQQRVGKHGKIFSIKKFRTMKSDAEAQGPQWAQVKDSRVTRVGSFLRRTHLDELPQMLNILRGDISLVGPRPERPEFVEVLSKEIPHYHIRHFVKPGFTGWAQIKFRYARSVLDSRKKFEYDLYYIKNRSLMLDVLILLKTIQLVFRG
ncbi:MAG: sugar transferase [Candidatus Uhrbacteria bacterium]|nr:sugar transferase [Candidatus Uhrbacteria bacterium]